MGPHRSFQKYLYIYVCWVKEWTRILVVENDDNEVEGQEEQRTRKTVEPCSMFLWVVGAVFAGEDIVQVVIGGQPLCGEPGLAESEPVSGTQHSRKRRQQLCVSPRTEPEHTFQRGHTTASCVFSLNLVPVLCDLISTEGQHNVWFKFFCLLYFASKELLSPGSTFCSLGDPTSPAEPILDTEKIVHWNNPGTGSRLLCKDSKNIHHADFTNKSRARAICSADPKVPLSFF